MRLWVAVLALGGSIAWGQAPARVEGRVLTSTGGGVGKAEVTLQGIGEGAPIFLEISDRAGRFVFEGIPAGEYALAAGKSGFAKPAWVEITLRRGEVRTGFEIKLVAQGVISGRVTDQDGDPISDIEVHALVRQGMGSRRALIVRRAVLTDDQGNFRLNGLNQGRYYIRAQDERRVESGLRRGRTAQEINTDTLYENVLELAPGAEVSGVQIVMRRVSVVSVRGKAFDNRSGKAYTGELELVQKDPEGAVDTTVPKIDGTFEFPSVLPGTYVLHADATAGFAGRQEVVVQGADLDGVSFRVSPATEIDGIVRLEDGDLRTLLVSMESAIRLNDLDGRTAPTGAINADGTFRIEHVDFSKYRAYLNVEGTYVKSMRFAGRDVTKGMLDLTSGAEEGLLEVILSQKTAEVTVAVRGDNADFVVAIWPKEIVDDPVLTFIGTGGDLQATGLAPGDYFVAAWEGIDPVLTYDPEFLALFERNADSVIVRESARLTVEVTPVPKDKVAVEIAKLP